MVPNLLQRGGTYPKSPKIECSLTVPSPSTTQMLYYVKVLGPKKVSAIEKFSCMYSQKESQQQIALYCKFSYATQYILENGLKLCVYKVKTLCDQSLSSLVCDMGHTMGDFVSHCTCHL